MRPRKIDVRPLVILAAFAAATIPTTALAGDDDAVTPYRPSVSNPAQLPVPGQLELELGGLRLRSDDSRRDSLPYQFKLAFNKDWGILLGGEAHISARDSAGRSRGFGDTNVVLKRAWGIDDTTAAGMEVGIKLPTAGDSLGSGKADYTVNTIYSKDLGAVHMDANLNAARLGATDPGIARMQIGMSVSFSTPLSDRWAAILELSGTHRGGTDNGAQFLGAVTFSPSKRLTFDAGVARAGRPAPGATSFFAGVVFPVTQLW